MKLIFILLITIIAITYIYNYLTYKKKKATYQKAGKKWDGIVDELRRRK